jgi:hypothetical protein
VCFVAPSSARTSLLPEYSNLSSQTICSVLTLSSLSLSFLLRPLQLYCERANLLGYDSIQFARPHYACMPDHCPEAAKPGYTSELLMCKAGCMTQEVHGACPPGVEMRQVDMMGRVLSPKESPCECSDMSDILNCGGGTNLYGKPDTGKQKCYTGNTGRGDEPLTIDIPEIRDIHQWHGCKCDMTKASAANPASSAPTPTAPVASSPAPKVINSSEATNAFIATNATNDSEAVAPAAPANDTVAAMGTAAEDRRSARRKPTHNYYLAKGEDGEPMLATA